MKKNVLVLIVLIGSIATAMIFLVYAKNQSAIIKDLPANFIASRQKTSFISQRIVELTSLTSKKIDAANVFDLNGDIDRSLFLINEARQNNSEAYRQAFDLSQELQKLTESLQGIKSIKAQGLAYEAIAVELALVSEFIIYTKNLNEFLDNLANALATDSTILRSRAADALKTANQNVKKINELNRKFLNKMILFDKAI